MNDISNPPTQRGIWISRFGGEPKFEYCTALRNNLRKTRGINLILLHSELTRHHRKQPDRQASHFLATGLRIPACVEVFVAIKRTPFVIVLDQRIIATPAIRPPVKAIVPRAMTIAFMAPNGTNQIHMPPPERGKGYNRSVMDACLQNAPSENCEVLLMFYGVITGQAPATLPPIGIIRTL